MSSLNHYFPVFPCKAALKQSVLYEVLYKKVGKQNKIRFKKRKEKEYVVVT